MSALTYQTVWLIYVELLVVTSVVLLFSTVTSPFTGGILSLLFFLIGHSIGELQKYSNTYGPLTAHPLWKVAFALFPDLERFNLKENALYLKPVTWGFVAQTTLYGMLLSAVFVTAAVIVFRQRDFT